MFTYSKTLNSHSVGVEPMKLAAKSDMDIGKGTICILENGYLKNGFTTIHPKYLTLDAKPMGESSEEIRCIRLLPGMILEGDYVGLTSLLYRGHLRPIGVNTESQYAFVDGTLEGEGTYLEILDFSNYEQTQKVKVIING